MHACKVIKPTLRARAKQLFFWAYIAITLTGCAPVMGTRNWHGHKFLYISCSGLTSSWAQCFKQAERICGHTTYEIIAQSNIHDEENAQYPLGMNPAGFSSRDLIVECDPSEEATEKLKTKRMIIKKFRAFK
ncbi:hypothetical protein [Pantoea sp. Tr-811]|uniref:hypothetical protein n=1 Tax=Pantoea sp. Tr-811 TaxID=2608361 RepID=UPI00196545A4|nr:hypothetical protein [Pantoea sp. Tr-811]